MATKAKVKKAKPDTMEPVTYTRPPSLGASSNQRRRQAVAELNKDVTHSKWICALEGLVNENTFVYKLLLEKLRS